MITLPELAIRRHVTTLMILVSLAVLGTVALRRLPLAFLPEMDEPALYVRLPYPNAAPEQIERMIVRPVEDALGSVKGLRRLWSRCSDDGGSVRLEFDWSVDLRIARVEVWEKLDRIRGELPEDMEDITVGEHHDDRETDDPVLEVRISSSANLSESYDLIDRRILKPLRRVSGVAQVRLDGVNPKEVLINLRLTDLELHNVDVRDISSILRSSNFDQSLGEIEQGDHRYVVRTVATFRTVEEIRNLVVRSDGLRLRHVADVTYEEPELEFGRHLDGNFAVGITVSAESTANVVEVCDALQARIREMQKDPELGEVHFFTWMSQGREIKKTLQELFYTGIFGALLASVVLYIFLRRPSSTLVSVLCIPFSLIVTCGLIWAQGGNLNTLTILGLIVGVGMLVDNAVVVMENIFRHQEMGQDRKTASRLGAREVSTAVIAATLTSVIVFLPILFNKPSRLSIPLREIGVTVCLTLLVSLFISQTLIPLATSWFIRSAPKPRNRWLVWLENRYVRILEFSLRHRWLAPVIGIAITASALYPYFRVDVNFDQHDSSRHATIDYHFSEESPLATKEAIVTLVEKAIEPHREELGAQSIYSYWHGHHSMTRIYLPDGEANEERLSELRAALRKLLPEFPGVRLTVTEGGRKSWHWDRGKRVAFQIIGEDPSILADLSEEAQLRIEAIDGLIEGFVSNDHERQELHVEMNRELASRHDITAAQLSDRVGLTFRGRRLQRFRTPDGEREMRLALDEREIESLTQLRNLPMWSTSGDKVPLASIATVYQRPADNRIERENRMTSVWVGAKYKTGKREDYIPQVENALVSLEFPRGYFWTFGSWQERRQKQSREFLVNLLLALLLVFAVMSSVFESVQQAVALMIALPFALSGAYWTLYLAGNDFDQPAGVGLLLLIGIVVNNGIVMIEHTNTYRRQGIRRIDALLTGCRERLRPILMTALTTLIGLVPMVISKPSLGGFYYYSMALVVMGGLVVSTFLTAILLPTTVTLVEDAWSLVTRPFRSPSSLEAEPVTGVPEASGKNVLGGPGIAD